MVNFPWRKGSAETEGNDPDDGNREDGVVTCAFQDGTITVHEDRVVIERSKRSKFADKEIPLDEVSGVTYSKRLVISYLQIEQGDVENSEGSIFTTPVDENTFHFGRGKRDCAKRARDEILARASAE
jgi:hypothetical protein